MLILTKQNIINTLTRNIVQGLLDDDCIPDDKQIYSMNTVSAILHDDFILDRILTMVELSNKQAIIDENK